MKNKNILFGILAIIVLVIVALILPRSNRVEENTFLKSVKNVYASALKEYDGTETIYSNIYEDDANIKDVDGELNYLVKFNDKGEVVYLVVSNGEDRFQVGSIYEETPINEKDITSDKVIKDVLTNADGSDNYVVINDGSNSLYHKRGYYLEKRDYITIALGEQTSGTHKVHVLSVINNNGEFTITVKDEHQEGDAEIQVLSYPFITISLRGVKVTKLTIKDEKGYVFEKMSAYKDEVETEPVKEEEIRSIIIEKKDVTDEELKTYDQDQDGQITTEDIKVIKDEQKQTGKVTRCSKGEHMENGRCVLCPVDTYGSDGKTCTKCPAETCSEAGSKTASDCKSCIKLTDPVMPPVEFE